ncbi:MAG: DUF58 domain-containing protein [Gemmatimonadaceae bacterium]|nr:DUF58 domain-containing protein [Gemmatimonadaceae bacterium]
MTVLSPAVVAAIDDLELAARVVVEGLRVGGHRSPFHGYGADFQQHRPYRAGDDLKYLDWKVYARSNRLYTRQFRETTNVSVMVVLDTSASMAFPESGLSKFRYASIMAAALAYLASEQGNAVGLMTMTEGALTYLPARSGRVHLRSLIAKIDGLSPVGAWQPATVIGRAAELLQRRGLLMVLSDFYDEESETQRELRHVVRHGHDVAMLQVVAPEERELRFTTQVELRDLESGARRLVEPATAAPAYRDAMTKFLERCRAFAQHEGIDYGLLDTSDAPERALRDYLVRRSARQSSPSLPSAQHATQR